MISDAVLPIASQVSGVLLVMVVGAVARRLGWLSPASDKSLAVLTTNILLPALLIDRIVHSAHFNNHTDTWVPPLVGFGCTCVGFGLSWLVIRIIGPWFGISDPRVQNTFVLTAGIANFGYIPIPLAEHFFPEALVPLFVHNVGVDLATWSVGVLVIGGGVGTGWRRAIASPPLWAVLIAVIIHQLQWTSILPAPLSQLAKSLGQCAIPVGLILSGAIIVDYWKDVRWRDGLATLGLACLLRQVIMPVFMLSMAAWMWLPDQMDRVLLLQASMPAATFPIVLVKLYGGDIPTALRVIVGTSLLGLVTIPFWMVIGKLWLGIA